jgi:AcrR family transcriptional regulator
MPPRDGIREALISSARRVFAEQGYAGARPEQVAQRAGVDPKALSERFSEGKEELFRAAFAQVGADLVRRVVAAAARARDPWSQLVAACEAFLDAACEREVQQILLIDAGAVLGVEAWRALAFDYALTRLEALLQAAIDAGQLLLPQPASALAYVVLDALEEAATEIGRAPDTRAARRELGGSVRALLEGLRAPGLGALEHPSAQAATRR